MYKSEAYLKRGPNTVSIMFAEMATIPMFPIENCAYNETQEYKVAKRSKAGDPEAKKEMIQRNYRLAMSQSKKFMGLGLPHEDLVQEGIIGLIRAVELFDPDHGNKFSTYAYWWVRQAMGRAVMEKTRTVRVPVHISETANKVRRFSGEFYQEFQRYPSSAEISAGLDIPIARVKDAVENTRAMVSLNALINEDQELMSVIPAQSGIEDELVLAEVRETLQKYLSQVLKPIEAEVISRTIGFPLEGDAVVATLKARELSSLIGRDTEEVRSIRAKAMRKLRAKLEHSPLMGLKDCLT